jgi:hypothetical protein
MILKLNVWQRFNVAQAIGEVEGNAKIIRKADRLLNIIELNEAEKKAVGWHEEGPTVSWKYKTKMFSIEIKDDNLAAFLVERVTAYVWPKGIMAVPDLRKLILDLYDQVGVKEE